MKFYLAAVNSFRWNAHCLEQCKEIAAQDRVGVHVLTDDPAAADIILFIDLHQNLADWWMGAIHRHPLTRAYRRKIFVLDERDKPWHVAPGVYVAMPRQKFDAKLQRAGCYFLLKNVRTPRPEAAADSVEPEPEPDLLFSFIGAVSHPVRREIVGLSHQRALIEDTSHLNFFSGTKNQLYRDHLDERRTFYNDVLARSKFVLCPRGMGTSSFRLFQTLAAGRVPVIISDDWVAPDGPDWAGCSLRVEESQISTLPRFLEEKEACFEELSKNASEVWREWFAPDVRFHRVAEACAALHEAGCGGPRARPMLDGAAISYGIWLYTRKIKKQLVGLLRRAKKRA